MLVWYVIQVINGREDVMRERIERMVPASAMQELFYPQFQTEIKVHGEWVNTTKPLFPGYLICDTADPRTVQQHLLRMDDFARVLSQNGQFVPLAKEEVQLIGGFTHRGDRVVPMSEALKDGDQVVVTTGPLLGHEGLIKTINRRKSTAYLELNLCGRRVTTRVGLAVLSNEQRFMRNLKKAIALLQTVATQNREDPRPGDEVLEENVSDKTEYVKDVPVDAARIGQARDWRADSQTPVATEFPLPVENPAPAKGYVETGSYRAPAADPNAAAPKKGGPGYFAFKRAFDIVFSVGVCAVLAVPVVAACVAIEIDSPGKPFFRQKRVGKGGKPIYIFKLRTMVSDAHEHPEKYMTPEQLAQWQREQKVDDDPRITRVGRFLRHTSLDELPQFINVLIGDLSVIGPRPVTLEETYEYGDARDEVLACKPGITGWWAATDRNDSTWGSGQRQARELFYVRHQSLGLDARVFVKTFKAMRRGK